MTLLCRSWVGGPDGGFESRKNIDSRQAPGWRFPGPAGDSLPSTAVRVTRTPLIVSAKPEAKASLNAGRWEQATAVMCGGKYLIDAQRQATGVGLARHARPLNIEALRHKSTDKSPILAMSYQDAKKKDDALLRLSGPLSISEDGIVAH